MTTPRENMLEALRAHLATLPGVAFVDRQGLRPDRLSDGQLPAILITEQATTEAWVERHHDRETEIAETLILDVQIKAPRERSGPGVKASTAREALRRAIIEHLTFNPTLTLELTEGAGEQAHCIDCAAGPFRARYMPEPEPYARFLLDVRVQLEDAHEDRASTDWQTLILERCRPEPADDDPEHALSFDLTPEP
jgi:hypothetical protein